MADDTPQDAIALIKTDHRKVEDLFEQFEKASGNGRKRKLAEKICMELTIHTVIEEEIFYPACRDALAEGGEMMLDEAEIEHASIKSLVQELEDADADDAMTAAKVKVLCEYVTHHVKEEEKTIFPKVKKSDLDLDELGAELMERKQQLMGEEEE